MIKKFVFFLQINYKKVKIVFYDYVWEFLFLLVIPRIWSLLRPLLSVMAKKSVAVYPENGGGAEYHITLLEPKSNKLRIQNFSDGLKDWVDLKVKPQSLTTIKSLKEIPRSGKPQILIISYEWMRGGFYNSGFSLRVFKLAYIAKKHGHKIWIMMCDSFDQRFVIPASFLVAYCGGSTVMMQNTKTEAEAFGLIHPSDPHLWVYSISTIGAFGGANPFLERKKIAVIALSGEARRIVMMKDIEKNLRSQGWLVEGTDQTLGWNKYVDLIRSSQITVTTCWLHQVHINGSKKNIDRLPETSLTGRVLEGFASGSVVFTTPSSVLDFLGFKHGIHYVLIPKSFEENFQEFPMPNLNALSRIGSAGRDHFLRIKLM
jgi:hypothetical protein